MKETWPLYIFVLENTTRFLRLAVFTFDYCFVFQVMQLCLKLFLTKIHLKQIFHIFQHARCYSVSPFLMHSCVFKHSSHLKTPWSLICLVETGRSKSAWRFQARGCLSSSNSLTLPQTRTQNKWSELQYYFSLNPPA